MLMVYAKDGDRPRRTQWESSVPLPSGLAWIDLIEPSPAEKRTVEAGLGIEVPTREEMQEIEPSSRLYQEAGALYMTASIVVKADTEHAETAVITFILLRDCLVTLRYGDPTPFRTFTAYAEKHPEVCVSGEQVLGGLMDAIVDRAADVLEKVDAELDKISREVFVSNGASKKQDDLQLIIQRVGRNGDLISRTRESMVSLGRVLTFIAAGTDTAVRKETRARVKTLARDVTSLSNHASFQTDKVSLLLNATLGMINIAQNAIIKIFSVAAVVFLPPTLIASIYGMNFEFMPELAWKVGYPIALLLMVLAAVLPYLYFKRRRWL